MATAVRYGVIGCGMMGQEHLRNIALLPGATVTSIFEPNDDMAAASLAMVPGARRAELIAAVVTKWESGGAEMAIVKMLTATRGRKRLHWTDVVSYLYLVVGLFVMFAPVLWLVMSSFKTESAIAHLAYEIEREELKLAGGKQDQYAAAFGGFNFIEFGPGSSRVLVNPLRIKEWVRNELETSTVLFYTGQSRESAKIIEQQIESTKIKSSPSLSAMFSLKQDATSMKEAILRGDLSSYANIMRQSWESKKKLAESVSNPQLDAIYDEAINAGALAGKISGAGGGGFFMFFVPPNKRMTLVRRLQKHAGQVINFHFTAIGSQSWVLNKISGDV